MFAQRFFFMLFRKKNRYKYAPKLVDEIVVREFNFEFPADLNPVWIPSNPVKSHFWNGISLVMPYLEPYLVQTNHEALKEIENDELVDDIKKFNAQEVSHFRCHRRVNELLKQNGYQVFSEVEKITDSHYKKLSKKKLITRLAYSAGFETMTKGFSIWMTSKRRKLWKGADQHMTSFWLMHLTEESEHKTVAFDVYMSIFGGNYFRRALGVLHGSLGVLGLSVIGLFSALKNDGLLMRFSTWRDLTVLFGQVVWNIGPFLLHAMLPWHNPRNFPDSQWVTEWLEGYKKHERGKEIPLLDTDHPDIPVPF